MNNQKSDIKTGDHEDGDPTQPINLVAARTALPVTSFSAAGSTASAPSLAMRTHLESKPSLMTVYFRTQSPRSQGQVMGPIVGTQVSSSQHFSAKPAQDFKSTSFTVIRMNSDLTQVQGSSASSNSSGAITPGILPTALAGGSSRHIIPTAVQPVIATGHSGPALASLIRGSHQVSSGHVIHPPFSSHVPRGPAAVASISTAPKSAVATPILRTPHSSGTMSLASSKMALHTPVRVKSPTLANRTATPPVASTSIPQVIDLQNRSSVGHNTSAASHVGLSSRTLEGSVVRSGNSHSSITIAKPMNISQPIVQHLQQVYEKGALKTVSNLVSASSNTSSHMSSPSAFTSSIQQLRSAHVPQALHTITTAPGSSQQTVTVIAAKSLQMPSNHSIALAAPTPRSATPITSVSSAGGNISIVPGPTPRSLTITNAITPATIPVAKVYPQSTISPRTTETASHENSVRSNSFIMQGVTRNTVETTTAESGTRSSNFIVPGITSSSGRNTAPITTSSINSSSIISDKQSESNTLRFTPYTKSQTGGGSSYTPSSTTYLYHDQYAASNLTMHPYNSNPPSQGFTTTQLRPVSFSQHSSSHSSSHSSVSNPVMVAVDSRHHVALHSSYSANSGKGSDTPLSLSTVGTTSSASSTTASAVTTSFNTLQSQSAVNNHTSPRPSILRKRPSESICNIAKKNLSGALSTSEPSSPRPDISCNISFTSVLSPKPVNEKPKEVVSSVTPVASENQNILIPVIPAASIKKEIDTSENSNPALELGTKDSRPLETSPRKKPRKQLLATNDLIETHSSDGEENNYDMKVKVKEEPGLVKDEEKSKYITYYKRPAMSLLTSYRQSWKARHNHFARYCDVKPKEEKKPTVSELANQKGILQQANGWKVYHLTAQMDEIINLEEGVYSRLSDLLEFVESDAPSQKSFNNSSTDEARIINKLTDLIKGNLQRSKIVQEQVSESKQQAIKVLDHKTNVTEMVNKCISKRPLKKKDKT